MQGLVEKVPVPLAPPVLRAGGRELAALALNRFGLGARPGDIATVAADPRGALLAELAQPAPALAGELPTTTVALTELDEFRTQVQRERDKEADAQTRSEAMRQGRAAPEPRNPAQAIFRREVAARLEGVRAPLFGVHERLARFFANHFCVSVAKSQAVRAIAGAYEREAIRPHVTGRFRDMLRAVESHPAMLIYLDNRQSIGPNSRAGARRGRGLNENLAREILELHTLGVHGGYSQGDVTALARMLTGWTVVGASDEEHELGSFHFNANRHEPGAQTMLGRSYPAGGQEQGLAALDDLARHPATAGFVCGKLARHFAGDAPPSALIETLARVFGETGGDLRAVMAALIRDDRAWDAARKLRPPQDFLIAAIRATGLKLEPPGALGALAAMGQPWWQPPGPNGFPDTADAWATPEGLKTRLDAAAQWARRVDGIEPMALLDAATGAPPLLTRQTVSRAESRAQGLTLALMSPEFQRR